VFWFMTSLEFSLASGYIALPELFVRNESKNTITFNAGLFNWELGAVDSGNNTGPLPWAVANSPGFQRVWEAGAVTVARDEDFLQIVTELPDVASGGGSPAVVFRQETPQSVTEIEHDLNRDGPVHITICSLDKSVEYYNFLTDLVTPNLCRVTFDDPTSFIATLS
jgi:hypothetical protein